MRLHSRRLPALTSHRDAPELLLLHGWGVGSAIWDEWLPLLRRDCHVTVVDLPGYGRSATLNLIELNQLLPAIVDCAPPQAVYLGYSLGGMLAVKLAYQYPQRVSALVTLASNLCFVANERWPWAMAQDTYLGFVDSVAGDARRALKRFAALQASGAINEKDLLKTLRAKATDSSPAALLASLQLLAELDNSAAIGELGCPSLQLLADRDQLVPVAVAEPIRAINQQRDSAAGTAAVVVVEQAPHSFFISQPQHSWSLVREFLQQQRLMIDRRSACATARVLDKQQVARSFSRAAASYDSVAELQRQVGEQLIACLPTVSAELVLDLGCGTGYFTPRLQTAFPGSTVVGLDLAQGMLDYAASHQPNRRWLCADAERLPLAEQSLDVIFSSLAIQWCEDYPALFAEAWRVLKPGGYLLFSTLGPNTLQELRSAWLAVDDYVHVNRFVEQAILAEAIKSAGFTDSLELQEEVITLQYPTVKDLTRELKSLGAHNVNRGRPAGLTGKRRLQQLIAGYELQRNAQQLLPASYQVWYGCLQKPLMR